MTSESLILESCEHLQLIPPEVDREEIQAYVERLQTEEDKSQVNKLTQSLFGFLGGERRDILDKPYIPHCKKNNSVCVVMDSPIMAMQQYINGRMYQPLSVSMMNTPRIRGCEDRELPETSYEGKESFYEFLLRRIVGQLNIEEEVNK